MKRKSQSEYMKKWRKENPDYDKKYYRKNKKEVDGRNSSYKKDNRKKIDKYKKDIGCKYCGENEPVVLDFHHLNPQTKNMNVADMVNKGYSLKNIFHEIEKCIVVCCNCHRKLESGLIA